MHHKNLRHGQYEILSVFPAHPENSAPSQADLARLCVSSPNDGAALAAKQLWKGTAHSTKWPDSFLNHLRKQKFDGLPHD
jgi:hypothetical protein